ncbi:MAG: class I SAM-dependent methyltransferase [Candidatus Omnitrophica bacterium]|nr:class I SAM-dependent methyltransferase [Candidatus Omnitrophota bacterium]
MMVKVFKLLVKKAVRKTFRLFNLEIVRAASQDKAEYRPRKMRDALDMDGAGVDIYMYASPQDVLNKRKDFERKLKSGHYKLESFSCPICSNDQDWLPVVSSKEPPFFQWSVCKRCGLLQLNKRLSDKDLNSFYESGEFHEIISGGMDDHTRFFDERMQAFFFIDIFNKLGCDANKLKILEIGCGSGGVLFELKQQGAAVRGFDLDPHKIAYGKSHLREIEVGDALKMGDINYEDFNFVLISNVLEHLASPKKFLSSLSARIKDDNTKILIDVPNLEGSHNYSSRSFLNFLHISHLWYFTSISLERLLNASGLKVDNIFNRGQSMSLICSKSDAEMQNTNNSYSLTISSINYANYKLDKYNVELAIRKATALGATMCKTGGK